MIESVGWGANAAAARVEEAPNPMSRPSAPNLWAQLFHLDPDAALTMQAQLRAQIVAAIGDGRIPTGRPMPSSRELAKHLGVARNTVVGAYAQLADDGYLVARDRRGYYVNEAARVPRLPAAAGPATGEVGDWERRFRLRPTSQRNISKVADWEKYPYPFIYGQWDPTVFPAAEWRTCCREVLALGSARAWAQDLFTRDDGELIEEIRNKVLPLRGVWAAPEEVLVTIGAQQALYLLADLLIGPDTVVGVEDPGYPDARNIFALRTRQLRPLAVDEQGLRLDPALDACDYLYVTPSHQSPTTVTMPVDRRLELLRRAARHDLLIIEDDYETETTYSGLPNPALKSLDRNGRVIYVGSLSKSFAPGLRLGYIVAPQPLVDELRALRRLMIRHPTTLIQRSFARFLALGYHDLLNRRLVETHRARAAVLSAALEEFGLPVDAPGLNGGSSVWLEGPAWLDAGRLADDLRAEGVLIEPGAVHYAGPDARHNTFRLGFSSIGENRIREGVRRIAAGIEQQRRG